MNRPSGRERAVLLLFAVAAMHPIWLRLAGVADEPYARGLAEGAAIALGLVVLVGAIARWRDGRDRARGPAVEGSGRKARWLAKHPDSVVGRG
ncbi:MAG: hypothetical protein JNM10_10570 [Planctomycetia bacterium]|nr:hypothetical protein [Planctomycetia bacterium]